MKIDPKMLASLAAIKTAATYVGEDVAKAAKKKWWQDVRQAYGLEVGTKYKVATTGENAGDLRFKDGRGSVPERPIGKYVLVDKDGLGPRYMTAEEAANEAEDFEAVALLVAA